MFVYLHVAEGKSLHLVRLCCRLDSGEWELCADQMKPHFVQEERKIKGKIVRNVGSEFASNQLFPHSSKHQLKNKQKCVEFLLISFWR